MSVKREILPDIAIHPGETLADVLEERRLNHAEIAALMGNSPDVVSRIIRGESDINRDIAVSLENALGIPAQFWINLQSLFDATQRRIKAQNRYSLGCATPKGVPR